MHFKALMVIVAALLVAGSCGSEPAFKEGVATVIRERCVAGLEKQQDLETSLKDSGLTTEDACTCALDIVAKNYTVADLTIMGDETMDVVFTNAGRICVNEIISE